MRIARTAAVLLGAAALALPAAAAAKGRPADAGHGHRVHNVTYVFRGTWSGGSVEVTGGNKHVRRAGLVGQSVEFDLSAARIVVRDVNGDGARDVSDLQDGDRVLVQARLPKGDPGDAPLAARKLVDRARGSQGSDDQSDSQDQ